MKSKDSSDSNAQKPAETETAATAPEKMAAQEKKATPGKNVAPKKVEETIIATASAPAKKAEKKAEPKKPTPEKKTPAAPTVILQSPFGGQNKLYWVKGEETGDKDIW